MANTFSNFYPTIGSERASLEFAKQSVALRVVDSRWREGAGAQAIVIPRFGYAETSGTHLDLIDELPGDTGVQTVEETALTLDTATNRWGFHFEIKYDEQDRAAADLLDGVRTQRLAALAAKVDAMIFAKAIDSATIVTGAVNKPTLVSAIEDLNLANVPLGDRFLVTNPAGYSDLLNDASLTDSARTALDLDANGANISGQFVGGRLGLDVWLAPASALTDAECDAIVFHRSALACAINREIHAKVYDHPRGFATGCAGYVSFDAKLIEPAAIVRIVRP
jgi:hypothetical protein